MIFHSDHVHGWLEVRLPDIKKAGLELKDFSHYSYLKHEEDEDGNTSSRYFLEEDRDATRFLEGYKQSTGGLPTIQEEHFEGDHWIRNLNRL
jgi:hypothetical protein